MPLFVFEVFIFGLSLAKYIDLFIKTLVQLPYDIYSNLVDIALKYYMRKYAICILKKIDNPNSIFNRKTQDNILLIY